MVSARANINPDILIWARQTVGLDIEIPARKIKVKPEVLEQWESGKKKPTIKQLRNIANVYKRSLAVFFLPSPPPAPTISEDFRRLPEYVDSKLSPSTLVEIRLCNRKREIALELTKINNLNVTTNLPIANLNDNTEELAQSERNFLNVDPQTQFDSKNVYAALKLWKNVLENKGILVFQSSGVPTSDMRGYSCFEEEFSKLPIGQ